MRRALLAVALLGVCLVMAHATDSFAGDGSKYMRSAACTVSQPGNSGVVVPARMAPQVHYDARTHATFAMQFNAEGKATVLGRAGELAIEKAVAVDGSFRLVLKAGNDIVTIAMAPNTILVERGNRKSQIDLSNATDDDFLAAKELLAGSRAIRLHRGLAANLDEDTLRAPAGVDTLLTDVLLAFLDGDPAAVERMADRNANKRAERVVRIRLGRAGCYEEYEAEALRCWNDYVDCKSSFAIWNPLREACTARFILWAESNWFHFISCTAIPVAAKG